MKADLQIKLEEGWKDISQENPEGPATFIPVDGEAGSALQVSIQALYESGPLPNPTDNDLIQMAEGIARTEQVRITDHYSDACKIGRFGCIVGKSEEVARFQIWVISNGSDFVLATYLCVETPDSREAAQAEQIVKTLDLIRS